MTDHELIRRAQEGDEAALEEMIQRYQTKIPALARKYLWCGLELEDLLQEGCIGLYEAVCRFDLNRGVSFWTFAQSRVRSTIRCAVTDHLGVPDYVRRALAQIQKAEEELTQDRWREPTLEEIADRVGLTVETIEAIREWPPQHVEPVNAEGEEAPELEIPEMVGEGSRRLFKEEACRDLLEAIACLPDLRDRVLVTSHHLDEIPINTTAQTLGMTAVTARQRLDRARERLRPILEGMGWTYEELRAALQDS